MPNLNKEEYGQVVRVNMLENVLDATVLNFILEPKLGEKLEKSASDGVVVGTTNITVDDEIYLANQYLEYTIQNGDLDYTGQWRIKGEADLGVTTGQGTQQIIESNMLTNDTSANGNNGDFTWRDTTGSGQWEKSEGNLNPNIISGASPCESVYTPGIGEEHRIKYSLDGTSTLFTVSFGGITLSKVNGLHDLLVTPTDTTGLIFTSPLSGDDVQVDDVEIFPMVSLPAKKVISDYKRIEVLA